MAQESDVLSVSEQVHALLDKGGIADSAWDDPEAADLLETSRAIVTSWLGDPNPERMKLAERVLTELDFRQNATMREMAQAAWDAGEPLEVPASAVYWTRKSFNPHTSNVLGVDQPATARFDEITNKWKGIWAAGDGATVRFGPKDARGGRPATLVTPNGETALGEPFLEGVNPFDVRRMSMSSVGLERWAAPGLLTAEQQSQSWADFHTTGLEPHPSVGDRAFGDIDERLGAEPAQPSDPDYVLRQAILFGKVKDENGAKVVEMAPDYGVPNVPLYDLSAGTKLGVTLADGTEAQVTVDRAWLDEMRKSVQGGYLGKGLTDWVGQKLFYPNEWVDTAFGPMLVVKVTGNADRDRELMRDPRWLRSISEAFGREGPDGLVTLSQSAFNVGEFTATTVLGGWLAKGFGRLLGAAGEAAGARLPLLATPARMAQVFAKTALPGVREMTAPAFRYGLGQLPANVFFETARGLVTGEGNFEDWFKAGWDMTQLNAAAGLITRGTMRLATGAIGSVGRAAGGKMAWVERLKPEYLETELGKRTNAAAEEFARKTSVPVDAAMASLRKSLDIEVLKTVRTGALNEMLHAGASGYLIGGYIEAKKVAARDGQDWDRLDWAQKWTYWNRAFDEGNPWSHVLAFMGAQAAHLPIGMRGSTKLGAREVDRMMEVFRGSLEMMRSSVDLQEFAGLMDGAVANDAKLRESFDAWLKDSTVPSVAALDENAPRPSKLEELEKITVSPGGMRRLERALEVQSDETLDVLLQDARTTRPDSDVRPTRLGIREAVEAELEHRATTGLRPAKKVRSPGPVRRGPKDLPRESWPNYFERSTVEFRERGKVDVHDLRGSSWSVAAVKDGWAVVRRRAAHSDPAPKYAEEDLFPQTLKGLRDAMGRALERAKVLDLQVQAADASKLPTVPARRKPATDWRGKPLSAEEQRLADGIEDMIAFEGRAQKDALGREFKLEGQRKWDKKYAEDMAARIERERGTPLALGKTRLEIAAEVGAPTRRARAAEPMPRTIADVVRSLGGLETRAEMYPDTPSGREGRSQMDALATLLAAHEDPRRRFQRALIHRPGTKGREGLKSIDNLIEELVDRGYFPGKEPGEVGFRELEEAIEANRRPAHEMGGVVAREMAEEEARAEERYQEQLQEAPDWYLRGEWPSDVELEREEPTAEEIHVVSPRPVAIPRQTGGTTGLSELEDAIARSDRPVEERDVLAAAVRLEPPTPQAELARSPVEAVSPALAERVGAQVEEGYGWWFGAGAQTAGRRAETLFVLEQDRLLAAAGDEAARGRQDGIYLGLLAATGGRADLVAAATGAEPAHVEAIWKRAVDAGRSARARIEAALADLEQRHGYSVLTPKQLAREDTFELAAVLSLLPHLEWRRSSEMRGTPAAPIEGPAFEKLATLWAPEARRALEERGVGPATAAAAVDKAVERLRGARAEIPAQLPDLLGRLQSKIGQAVPGMSHRSGRSAQAPDGTTLGELTDELATAISGSAPVLRGAPRREAALPLAEDQAQFIGELGISLDVVGTPVSDVVKGEIPFERSKLYLEAAMRVRDIARSLSGIVVDGIPLLPTSEGGMPRPIRELMADPMLPTILRQLAMESPELRGLLERGGMDPAEYPELVEYARVALAAQRKSAGAAVADQFDVPSLRQFVAIDRALAHQAEHPETPLPTDIRDEIAKPTAMFPEGALDAFGAGVHPAAPRRIAELWYEDLVDTRARLVAEGRIADAEELQNAEPIPLFAFPGFGPRTAVRRHVLYEAGLGSVLSLKGKGWRAITDWAVHQPAFQGKAGRMLLRSTIGVLRRFVTRAQSSGFLPSEVSRGNWQERRIRLSREYQLRRFHDAAVSVMRRMAETKMLPWERKLTSLVIDSDALTRMTPEQFTERWGARGAIIHATASAWVEHFNQLGEELVEAGVLSPGQLRQLAGRYYPATTALEKKSVQDPVRGLSRHRGSPRELPRAMHEEAGQAAQMEWDAALVLPRAAHQEAMRVRTWGYLRDLARASDVVLSEAEYRSLPAGLKLFYTKAAEPYGGKLARDQRNLSPEEQALPAADRAAIIARRAKAPLASIKLHEWLKDEERFVAGSGAPDTEIKRQVTARLRDGYVSRETQAEIDLLLDHMEPEDRGTFSKIVGATVQHWKAVKTVRRPEHWVLQVISGPVQNNATGRVGFGGFVRSVTTGTGHYANAARHAWEHFRWVQDGKPGLDPLAPSTARIRLWEEWEKSRGGSTMVQTAFDARTAGDMLLSMYETSGADRLIQEAGVLTPEVLRAGALANLRRGASFSKLDAVVAELQAGSSRKQAEALGALFSLYQTQENYWGFVNLLEGMERGLSFREAAEWAAGGTGDLAERSAAVTRFTTNFTGGKTDLTRRAKLLGGRESLFQKVARMGLGSPFWMWRSVQYPNLAQGAAFFPLRFLSSIALGGLAVRGISAYFGGDERRMRNALGGHGDWLFEGYSQAAFDEAASRFGHLGYPLAFGGILPRWAGLQAKHFLQLARTAYRSPAFWTATGPRAGGVTRSIDMGQLLFPGPAELLQTGRAVAGVARGERGSRETLENAVDTLGFVPFSMAAGFVAGIEAIQGVKGERKSETRWKAILKGLSEFTPETSPLWPVSAAGQDFSRQVLADGQTLPELAARLPGSRTRSTLGERLETFATGALLPMRQAPTYEAEGGGPEGDWTSLLRGAGLLPREGYGNEIQGPLSVRERKVHAALRDQMVAAYRNYIDQDGLIPLQTFVANMIFDAGDYVLESGIPVDVVPQPKSEVARWIRRQSDDPGERQAWIGQWADTLTRLGPILQTVALEAGNRAAIPPEVFARVVGGIVSGREGEQSMLHWLYEHTKDGRPGWVEAYDGELLRLWRDAGISGMSFDALDTGQRREWESVQRWIEARLVDPPAAFGGRTIDPRLLDLPMGRGLEFIPEKTVTFGDLLKAIQ